MRLPACHSRRELQPGKAPFYCAHPDVHVPDQLVTAEICRLCNRWSEPPPDVFRPFPPVVFPPPDAGPCFHLGEQAGLRDCPSCQGNVRIKVFECRHPLHVETTLAECSRCGEYDARLAGGTVRHWAVGMTTAPRKEPTIERTLASLAAAGWDTPRVFTEPGVNLTGPWERLPITRRDEPLGAWPNWFLGLAELVAREPRADAYFMVQDDVVFCRNLRPYLEAMLWPCARVGVVSPYCPAPYVRRSTGWHEVTLGENLAGAVSYIFPNAAARLLLADARVVNHRQRGGADGLKYIDTVVGRWAAEAALPAFYHTPSLAQHIGDTSVIWPQAANDGLRRAADFAGEDFDANELTIA
ncbi:MAG TPA: hypothetical protein VGX76_22685 [Pirellulales bacterium]|nr:hypothetical protein [Pirellulales bacterium]